MANEHTECFMKALWMYTHGASYFDSTIMHSPQSSNFRIASVRWSMTRFQGLNDKDRGGFLLIFFGHIVLQVFCSKAHWEVCN